MRTWLLLLVLFVVVGCASVSRSVEDYNACMADPQCADSVNAVRDNTRTVVTATSSALPLPSIPEVVGLIASNVIAFAVGVRRGGKLRR